MVLPKVDENYTILLTILSYHWVQEVKPIIYVILEIRRFFPYNRLYNMNPTRIYNTVKHVCNQALEYGLYMAGGRYSISVASWQSW